MSYWNRHLLNVAFLCDIMTIHRDRLFLNHLKPFENFDLQLNFKEKTFGEMLNSSFPFPQVKKSGFFFFFNSM